jgi:uncharacterized membrane protein YfcA
VLVYLLHQDPHAAAASSLVIVGITAITSLPHRARAREIAWRDGAIFGAVGVVGSVLGSRLSVLVPSGVLMILFGCMLAVVAVVMARRARAARLAEDEHVARKGRSDQAGGATTSERVSIPALIGTATFTGFLTGFFGVGGGFIVVPMLVIALGLGMRRAAGTSLLVMIVTSVAGLLARIGTPVEVDWAVTILFAAGSSLGGILGGPLSARARPSTLTWVFAGLLAAVAVVTLVAQLV